MYTIYQVTEGDTLASVANKYGLPISDLANINGIMMGTQLNPGDYIVVPKIQNDNLYFEKYLINKGDTIYGIARKYDINPSYLLRLNGLNESDIIYPGDTLFVPRDNVKFYITGSDDTLNDVIRSLNISPNDLANQNSTIYLTNDQLIVYRK